MDCWWADSGLLVAQMRLHSRPMLVKSMLDEWLHRYRQLAHGRQTANQQNNQSNATSRLSPTSLINKHHHELSSDEGETDDE